MISWKAEWPAARAAAAARLAGLLMLTGLGACTLGPDPEREVATAADGLGRFMNAQESSSEPVDPTVSHASWWRGLADPVTSELVERAISGNTDLRLAAARVLEAEAGLARARGARWPTADLVASVNRTKSSFVLPGAGRVGIYSTTLSHDLEISYQLDLFGRLTRTRQAAWSELLASEADRLTVVHSVISQVVRARAQAAGIERELDLVRQSHASWNETVGLIGERYRLGLTDPSEVHLTRQSLSAVEASIPDLEQQLAAVRHGLDVLVGQAPGTGPRLPRTLPMMPALDPVPLGLPAELLDRRPDLVMARMSLKAATARVGVAMADLFPSLSLTGSAGGRSDSLSDLASSETLVYSLVSGLVAPIFHGGQLRAEVRAAEARAEQAAALYAGAVLQALREVEDALVAEEAIGRQLQAHRAQLESATAAEELARSRYHAGTSDLLQLLVADRARTDAERAFVRTVTAQWEARVALLLALGGDWTTPAAVEPVGRSGAAGRAPGASVAGSSAGARLGALGNGGAAQDAKRGRS